MGGQEQSVVSVNVTHFAAPEGPAGVECDRQCMHHCLTKIHISLNPKPHLVPEALDKGL